MTTLGKCFVFHLKYWQEMDKFYWEEKTPKGLENADEIMNQIRIIGDQYCVEINEFFKLCGIRMNAYFDKFCKIEKIKTSSIDIAGGLEIKYRILKRNGSQKNGRVQLGIYIEEQTSKIYPWIWVKGGKKAENELAQVLLRKRGIIRSDNIGWRPGTIALDCIDIFPEGHTGFDIDAGLLIKRIDKAFRKIKNKDVLEIFKIV